ncbi:MAG: polysaccharide biosynthesis tyrosine autokinase [Nitrospinae bacterium]|nr:polysaccharide biosynthesis tyrosine autokinase [Nitrospinota bacterium]
MTEENKNLHFSLREMEKKKKEISSQNGSVNPHTLTAVPSQQGVGVNLEAVSPSIVISTKGEETVDIRHYWEVILHRKWVILLVALVIFTPTLYKSLNSKITYSASTQILLKEGIGAGTGMAAQLGLKEGGTSLDTLSAIGKTTPFLERIIQKLGLPISPVDLSEIIEVAPNRSSSILDVTVTFEDAKKAVDIANTFAKAFIEYNLELSQKETNHAIETTELQIKESKDELEKIEEDIQRFLKEEGAASPVQEVGIKMGQLANIEGTITGFQTQLNGIESEIVSVKKKLEVEDPTLIIETRTNRPLHDQLVQLEIELATTKTRRTLNHPEVIAIRKNIDSIKNLIKQKLEEGVKVETVGRNPVMDNLLTRMASLETERSAVSAKIIGMEKMREELRKVIGKLPEKEIVFTRLERQKRGIEQVYLQLQTKYHELKTIKEGRTGNLYHIQPAIEAYPVGVEARQIAFLGILVGLTIGIGLAFFLEYLDNTMKTPMDVKTNLGLNILGVIPKFKEDELFVNIEDQNSNISEVFRLLRNNLRYTSFFGENKVVMITSSQKGEGKTYITRNIGVSAVMQGKAVILIDADMRKMTLSRLFGIKRHDGDKDTSAFRAGLSDYLVGEVQLRDIILKTKIEGLRIIPAGTRVPNTAELLHSPRMRELLSLLKNEADNIYIDSPAVLPVVDATVLGSEVDGVIFVVGSRLVAIESAKNSVERLRHVQSNILGCIISMIKRGKIGYYRRRRR